MSQVIPTPNGDLKFEPVQLYSGRKKINKEIAKAILIDVSKILEENLITYGLIYGTLLGAYRDNDFIEWDEDVDIFVLDEFRDNFLSMLDFFQKKGLEIIRYEGDLLSLMRQGDYIDIYFFKKNKYGGRSCGNDVISNKYFEKLESIDFLGKKFPTLGNVESFLITAYGQGWRVPCMDRPASVLNFSSRIRLKIRPFIPLFIINFYRRIKG